MPQLVQQCLQHFPSRPVFRALVRRLRSGFRPEGLLVLPAFPARRRKCPPVGRAEEGRTARSRHSLHAERPFLADDGHDGYLSKYISSIADLLITEDGASGEIIDVLNRNSWPILITHWQSLFSNGLGTGLKALNEVGRRIEKNLADRVEWMSAEQLMRLTLDQTAPS